MPLSELFSTPWENSGTRLSTITIPRLYLTLLLDGCVHCCRYLRQKLVEPNPDELEIAKLRTKLNDAKTFRDFLLRENKSLRERIEKYDKARLMVDDCTDELSNQSLSCSSIKNKNK